MVRNGHSQANPNVELFGIVPTGSEPTGITFSPDNRFLFMSIQHPSNGNAVTTQTDAANIKVAFDKSTTIVIALKENLGLSSEMVWYLDADGDGYAVSPSVLSATSPGQGYTTTVLPLTDCDDTDATVFEVATWYLDVDGDGFAVTATVESCNSPGTGYTKTVLPKTDCDDTDAAVFEVATWYLDADGDGFAVTATVESCNSPGTGYTKTVLPTTDCDDTNANVFEIATWYLDADGDGFAVTATVESCNSPGTGYTKTALPTTDCDDTDAELNPETLWYLDANNDSIADTVEFIISCESPGIDYTTAKLTPFADTIEIQLYPNPTQNSVDLDFGKLLSQVDITLVNASGQLIKTASFTNTRTINLSLMSLASGLYYVAISSDNKILGYQKISKQ